MKNILFILPLIFILNLGQAQSDKQIPAKAFDLYPTLTEMYGYAYGWHNNQLLIVGGKIKTDVPELSLEDFPNTELILLDFDQNRASAFSSGSLEGIIFEQMSSTGLAFYQKEHYLYLIGGYGYTEQEDRFITFPYITAINLEGGVEAMLKGENPAPFFYQICEDRLAIFNGTMDYNDEEFFLINGKKAHLTNPFSEEATYYEEDLIGQVRTFQIEGELHQLKISNFQTWYDIETFDAYYGPLVPEKIRQEMDKFSIIHKFK